MSDDEITVREEWEVTGDPGDGYPFYRFVFGGPFEGDQTGTPEERARNFYDGIAIKWPSQALRKRIVTETPWASVSSAVVEAKGQE